MNESGRKIGRREFLRRVIITAATVALAGAAEAISPSQASAENGEDVSEFTFTEFTSMKSFKNLTKKIKITMDVNVKLNKTQEAPEFLPESDEKLVKYMMYDTHWIVVLVPESQIGTASDKWPSDTHGRIFTKGTVIEFEKISLPNSDELEKRNILPIVTRKITRTLPCPWENLPCAVNEAGLASIGN